MGELVELGLAAGHLTFELEDRAAVEGAIPAILERHGSIWGLVNNAGMVKHEDTLAARGLPPSRRSWPCTSSSPSC